MKDFGLSAPQVNQTWCQETRFPLLFFFFSWSLMEKFNSWQVLLERWWLEVVWNLRIFQSSSIVDTGVIQGQGNTQGSMDTLCFLGSFGNICNCKQLTRHCPFTLVTSPWNFAWGTQGDLLVQYFLAPGNFWDGCCEVQNEQCPSAKSWECKGGQPAAQSHECHLAKTTKVKVSLLNK